MSAERLVISPDNEALNAMLHNPEGQGWYFGGNGDPELWKYADRLVKPGGKVLDLGIGHGRNSLPFALWGMDIVGYDTSPAMSVWLDEMTRTLAEAIPVSLEVRNADVFTEALGQNQYDLAIISELVHIPLRATALNLFDKTYDALKPGGHMWVRMAGKGSLAYRQLVDDNESYGFPTVLDDGNVIEDLCGCTGEERLEPVLYLDQMDLLKFFTEKNADIVHSQSIPQEDRWNIMFGEDFKPYATEKGAFVSALAQKR